MADEVLFGTLDWLDMFVKLYNERPELQEALKDLDAKVGYEFTDRPDLVPKFAYIKDGVVVEHGEFSDPSTMDYVIKGNYETWKQMTMGEIDPMNALMAGKVKVQGNMAALLKHADGFKQTFDVVSDIPTKFD
jgi:putative sterol carrier protein